jgi:hypothetical protein
MIGGIFYFFGVFFSGLLLQNKLQFLSSFVLFFSSLLSGSSSLALYETLNCSGAGK